MLNILNVNLNFLYNSLTSVSDDPFGETAVLNMLNMLKANLQFFSSFSS